MISIVLPLYNKEKSIKGTIDSVLRQNFVDFELIVIDDGSGDNSVNIVKEINDKRISIYSKRNGGVSSARNLGIIKAKFEYIGFIDGDDIWESNYLQKMVGLISQFPDAGIYGSAWAYKYKQKVIVPDFHINAEVIQVEDFFSHARKHTLFSSSSVIVRKNVFDKVGLFDERIKMGEDLDMWIRINLFYKAAFINEVLAYYVLDADNRACTKLFPLDSHLLMYLSKYDNLRKDNIYLDIYLGYYCLRQGVPYYFNLNDKDKIHDLLNNFSLSNYSFFWRFVYSSRLWNTNRLAYLIYKKI